MHSPTAKILFVEDEPALAEIIKDTLEARSFEVSLVNTAAAALQQFEWFQPHLLLLDVSLPDADGYAIARTVRQQNKSIPILFLTARSLPQDVIAGFESGGNDYVKKPFNIEELLVRIRALLSQNRHLFKNEKTNSIIEFGSFRFYYQRALLQKNNGNIVLTAREAELLHLLLLNHNQVLSRSTLLQQIWGNDDFFSGRSMDVFISKLRKHLKDDPSVQIMNIRGVGYKLIY